MDICAKVAQFLDLGDGTLGMELQAIGRQGTATYGPISVRLPWTWPTSRQGAAALVTQAQAAVRQAFSDAYDLPAITTGRFVVIELLG